MIGLKTFALGDAKLPCESLDQSTPAPSIGAHPYGVYDIAQTMTGKPLAYEEIFVDQTSAEGWVGTNQQSVYEFATAAWAKGRTPIISIEPFSGDPLDEIVSGKRDKELANICSQLAQYGGPAIIRWGHEAGKVIYPLGRETGGEIYLGVPLRSGLSAQMQSPAETFLHVVPGGQGRRHQILPRLTLRRLRRLLCF